ncbi:MAG: alanine--tRNA ligase [Parachlamydiales bacterium]|nr:alanine--tRNA ligase [Parachlamydiales bacterium]
MNSEDIRRGFLNYFKTQGHKIVPSSPVVPHDDPTLLFTNAGMNQFKDVFLGKSKRSYTRATTTQKCIRAGGKHNDLENVGFTSRHLTFFEMLGNFSFGDYFKEDAIRFAYDISCHVFGFDPERIWASVYEEDDEAFEIWKNYLPEKRLVRFGKSENFWAMGDTGPCGPCSELLYDRGKKYSDATSPIYDKTGERYPEFWNLVFMQFNQDETGKMTPLPKPCIDTGAGLERVVAFVNGYDNIFLTDVLRSLIAEVEDLSKIKYDEKNIDIAPAFHVIADHIRSLAFAIADGAVPSNVDRGYVLRKILRRAFRYGKILNFEKPFLAKLLPRLNSLMGKDFPELKDNLDRTAEILTMEEESFIKTLQRGGNLMNGIISLAKKEKRMILGEEAFKLKDTYGFPIEEVTLLAKDEHLQVDLKKYDELEKKAKEISKSAHEKVHQKFDENFFADFTKTHKPCEFLGHNIFESESRILALIQGSKFVDTIKENDLSIIILDKTPFYAEMGGQTADKGQIFLNENIFEVEDTQSPYPGVIVHIGKMKKGKLSKQEKIKTKIDIKRRKKIEANHSATHLIHWALSQVLGQHIKQAGSLVDEFRLRFDFDHHKAVSKEEVRQVERLVNEKIRENIKVKEYEVLYEDVLKDPTIKQIFGEKYSDKVRVIDMLHSKELCGGSHTSYTGDIGYFRIFKESSIAAGVRRIEALTGEGAEDFSYEKEDLIDNISSKLKVVPQKLEEKVLSMIEDNFELNQKFKKLQKEKQGDLLSVLTNKTEKVNSINILMEKVDLDPKQLQELSQDLLNQLKSAIVVLASEVDSRCQIIIRVSQDLIDKKIFANDLIKEIAPIIQGGGGGKKDSAQAGGKEFAKVDEAFEKIKQILIAK